jgi:hypothetical protein
VSHAAIVPLTARRTAPLCGRMGVPADTSMSRRALRMGASALAQVDGGRMPLTMHGATDPIPIVYAPPANLQ